MAHKRSIDSSTMELSFDAPPAWVIYVLCDPRETDPIMRVRYVGVTRVGVEIRFKNHIAEARAGKQTHKCNWIRSLLSAGMQPLIDVVEPGTAERAWDGSEVAWIRHFRDKGCPLVNGTSGGEGMRATPETRAKMSATMKAQRSTPEYRAKQSAAAKAISPECRAKMVAAMRAAQALPGAREKQIAGSKAAYMNPEYAAKHKAAQSSPEYRARQSELLKAARANLRANEVRS